MARSGFCQGQAAGEISRGRECYAIAFLDGKGHQYSDEYALRGRELRLVPVFRYSANGILNDKSLVTLSAFGITCAAPEMPCKVLVWEANPRRA